MSYPLRRALEATIQEVISSDEVSFLLNDALAKHLEAVGLEKHNTDEDLLAIEKVEFVPAPRKLVVTCVRGGQTFKLDLSKKG